MIPRQATGGSRESRGDALSSVHLVLFDGLCGLCDRLVRRLLRADRRGVLRFAPLQGATRREVEIRLGGALPDETIVLVRDWLGPDERVLTRSEAACAIAGLVGGRFRPLSWLRFLPRPLRDAGYDFVARRRSRWFGRLEACRVPTAAERARFLD